MKNDRRPEQKRDEVRRLKADATEAKDILMRIESKLLALDARRAQRSLYCIIAELESWQNR